MCAFTKKHWCWIEMVQTRKGGDTGKSGRKVAARRTIRRPSGWANMLSIWQNRKWNKKSSMIFYSAAPTYSASPIIWDAETWMSKLWSLYAMTLESCAWTTELSKQPRKNTIGAPQIWVPLGPTLPHGNLFHCDEGALQTRDLIENIILFEKALPDNRRVSLSPSTRTKSVAVEGGNYRGLKLLDRVMKVLLRVAENFLWQHTCIDDMRVDFMSGHSTKNTIFIVRHVQEKSHVVNNTQYKAFVNLEKHLIVYPYMTSAALTSGW